MDKKYYVFGANSTAELLYHYLTEENVNVAGFLLNEEYIEKNRVKLPAELFSAENIIAGNDIDSICVYLSIGYSEMNRVREKVYNWLKSFGVNVVNYIHPSAVVSNDVEMGDGNIIMEHVIIQPFCKLGNGNVLWSGSVISHHDTIGSFNHFSPGTVLSGRVTVHDRCFLGTNSTIKNGVEIHNEVLVGAGAYVSCDLKDNCVIVPQRNYLLNKSSIDMFIG